MYIKINRYFSSIKRKESYKTSEFVIILNISSNIQLISPYSYKI